MKQPQTFRPIDRATTTAAAALAIFAARWEDEIQFHSSELWAPHFNATGYSIYDIAAIGDKHRFYDWTRDGENIVATYRQPDRRAAVRESRSHAYENHGNNEQICNLYETGHRNQHGTALHIKALHDCAVSSTIHAILTHKPDDEVHAFNENPAAGERNNERHARNVANAIFPLKDGERVIADSYNDNWRLAREAVKGVHLRLKLDGQRGEPAFRLAMTDAEFKAAFCTPVRPVGAAELRTPNYHAGTPITLHLSNIDIKPGAGVCKLQQKVGSQWLPLPVSDSDRSQIVISESAPWTPPPELEIIVRAECTGFVGINDVAVPTFYSNEVSLQRQATPPANG